ncbi:hypothetical protein [Mycobacterium colombiense]|uniref:hypothetical protein n=1 Tax=Mycobacterium colombiense TaxID=339268 RepID=UPI00200A9450|nr:hypothetical protein [Mycobacterium colombiense]MCK8642963.1 hypothetical protein [Mycobacterium colombiense]
MDADADAASITTGAHPLRMSGRAAFYSFSFDLGPELDFVKLANKLLKMDMATVAGSPSREGLRVGRRVAATHRFHRKYAKTVNFYNTLYDEKFSVARLWKIDRLQTLKIIWLLRSILSVALLRWARSSLRLGDPAADQTEQAEAGRSKTIDKSRADMNAALYNIREVFIDQLMLGAMRLRLEQQIYFPRYYAQLEPFIRLEMNRAHFTDGEYEDEPIEVSLMIHRSGICILTFATSVNAVLHFGSASDALLASARHFDAVKLSKPIFSYRDSRPDTGDIKVRAEKEIHEGLQWFSLIADKSATVANQLTVVDVFYFYLHVIQSLARRQIRYEWRCFSTLFLGKPACGCVGAEAKRVHGVDFGQLLIRSRSPYPVKDDFREELLENHLVTTHAELWLSAGCAIHTYWTQDNIDYLSDIKVIEPIEFAILQYSQLEAVDTRTVNIFVRDRDLFQAQKQIATNMPEYGRNLMSDVDAPRVISRLSALLNTVQVSTRINDRVKILESIVTTRYTRRQSRRSLAIASIGLLIVVLLLLPRVDEMINKLLRLSPTSGAMTSIINHFGTQDRATFALYWFVLAATAAIFAAFTIRVSRKSLLRRRHSFGYSTEHDVVVTHDTEPPGDEPDSSAGLDPAAPASQSDPPANITDG